MNWLNGICIFPTKKALNFLPVGLLVLLYYCCRYCNNFFSENIAVGIAILFKSIADKSVWSVSVEQSPYLSSLRQVIFALTFSPMRWWYC